MTVNIDELRDSAISAQQNPEYRSAERLEGLADGTIEALDHLETAIRENAALRERAEKAERQAAKLTELIDNLAAKSEGALCLNCPAITENCEESCQTHLSAWAAQP